jgi:hypothetical protein
VYVNVGGGLDEEADVMEAKPLLERNYERKIPLTVDVVTVARAKVEPLKEAKLETPKLQLLIGERPNRVSCHYCQYVLIRSLPDNVEHLIRRNQPDALSAYLKQLLRSRIHHISFVNSEPLHEVQKLAQRILLNMCR